MTLTPKKLAGHVPTGQIQTGQNRQNLKRRAATGGSARLPTLAMATLLLASASPALGQPAGQSAFADLATIDHAVAGFAGAEIGQPGGALLPVDRRLRLSPCAESPEISWRDSRHETVLVQCKTPGGWHIFVPMRGTPSSGGGGPLAVARGEAVTISVIGDGFAVSQSGEAMDGGAVGEWIRVRTAKDASARGEAA